MLRVRPPLSTDPSDGTPTPTVTAFADARFVSRLRDVYDLGGGRFAPEAFVRSLRDLADRVSGDDARLVVRWYEFRWPGSDYVSGRRARALMEVRRGRKRGWFDPLAGHGIRVITRPGVSRPPRLSGVARDVVAGRLSGLGHDAGAELDTIDAILATRESIDAGVGDVGMEVQMALDLYHHAVRGGMTAALLLADSGTLGPAARLCAGETGGRVPSYLVVPQGYERGRRPRRGRSIPGRLRRAVEGELLLPYQEFSAWFPEQDA